MTALETYNIMVDTVRQECVTRDGRLSSAGMAQIEVLECVLDTVGPDASEEDFDFEHERTVEANRVETWF